MKPFVRFARNTAKTIREPKSMKRLAIRFAIFDLAAAHLLLLAVISHSAIWCTKAVLKLIP